MSAPFSPSEAALEGFRLLGRRPGAFLIWTLVMFTGQAAIVAIVLAVFRPEIQDLAEAIKGGGFTSALFGEANHVQVNMMWPSVLTQVLFGTAVFRTIFRPKETAFGSLRVGMDELIQLFLRNVLGLLLMLMAIALVLVAIVLSAIGLAVAGVERSGMEGPMILSCLLALLVILPTIVLVSLRWSLSPVVSFVKRRFRLFDSWKLTRGHVWRLLAAYLLGAIFSFVVTAGIVLVAGIAALIVFFTSGARNAYALHGVSLDTALVLAPTYAAFFLPFAMSQIIGLAVMNAIPAYVYRHITSPPEAT